MTINFIIIVSYIIEKIYYKNIKIKFQVKYIKKIKFLFLFFLNNAYLLV